MLAHYVAFRSGHALNNRLLRTLLADRDSWDIVTFYDAADAPPGFAELPPAW
jgi:UDP-3-O-[3-hydroxymyristoyl] N-acetylglucosamine deacetylase